MQRRRIIVGALATLGSWPSVFAAERIIVGGSGSPIPLTQELARAFLVRSSGDEIVVLSSSLGEAGGLKATAEGRLQVGIIARRPEGEELAAGLVWKVYALVPAVVAVNSSVPLTDITAEQILDIYGGRITNWAQLGGPDARIIALTRSETDMNKRAWRLNLRGFRDLAETKDAIVLVKGEQMLTALESQPHSIGLTDTVAVAKGDGKLRALSVNGIAPTPENVRSRRYGINKEFVAVTQGEPGGLARRFVEFLATPEACRIIAAFGAVPVA